ncbi:MAG: glycoside hydrolase family 57 protein [Nitrospinaceae bacterium]
MNSPKGYLALVLHAHLPFVRHPEYNEFLEEDWLFEAITETYIPLIHIFEGLVRDETPFRLTLTLTPTLLTMLADPLLQERYRKFLDRSIELSCKEMERTRLQPEFHDLARMYHWRFSQARETFVNRYQNNLIPAFRKFQELGRLELITCGATHGYLPLIGLHPPAVRAQIQTAVQTHEKFLGRKPRGIWLPECAYQPGIEQYLEEAGIRFFFTDTHGILHAQPRPKYGVFAPIYLPNGVAAFGRDVESSKQVWSANEGYPGDYYYREYYRDIGFDLEYDYVKPYISPTGERKMTGFKYYRITGANGQKEPYVPERALSRGAEHAGHFMFNREKQVEHLAGMIDKPPIVVAPYDAELFGHWWFEGPEWLNFLIRKIAFDQDTLELTHPGHYLNLYPTHQVATPSASSWGYKGFHEYWLGEKNDWIYRHLHKAAERMVELTQQHPHATGLVERALNQAARELLLAQGSDWAFIMTSGTMVEYAIKRTRDHLNRFNRLYRDIRNEDLDPEWLAKIEAKDNIFPDLDFRVYTPVPCRVPGRAI